MFERKVRHTNEPPKGGGRLGFSAESLRALPHEQRAAIIASLSVEEAEVLKYTWEFWARDTQLEPPGDWIVWAIVAGRGFGKTRTGVEFVRKRIESGKWGRVALVGSTSDDTRAVLVEGESGILNICPKWNYPKYEPSKRRITWPNGAIAILYSADEPDRLRGPQHHGAACDEPCAWNYPEETFDMLMMGLRLGPSPQVVFTTTPKPTKFLKNLLAASTTHVTRGSTYDNIENLPRVFTKTIIEKYKNTRLGRQEIEACILDDVLGALWSDTVIEDGRVHSLGSHYNLPVLPGDVELVRVVVALDPAGKLQEMARMAAGLSIATQEKKGDDAGIIVCGRGNDEEAYVFEDCSCEGSPEVWGNVAVDAYIRTNADAIVVEYNHGGETAEEVIRICAKKRGLNFINIIRVWASKGKYTRAEPVSALYEQKRVHHVDCLDKLEDEMTSYVPGKPSPNRMDAMVFGVTDLMITAPTPGNVAVGGKRQDYSSVFGA